MGGATLPVEFTGISLEDAVDDLYQGAFTGTVLTQQRMDFTPLKLQIDGIIGAAAGKLLGDTAQFQQRLPVFLCQSKVPRSPRRKCVAPEVEIVSNYSEGLYTRSPPNCQNFPLFH